MLATLHRLLNTTRAVDFLGPLALRLYLVPVFWMAGTSKWSGIENTVAWFEHSLGFPLPTLMAYLATLTEIIGAVFLLIGFAVRWISIPLMITMLVAAFSVHWENGWAAIGEGGERLDRAVSILQEHGNYAWLTENGEFVVLNNGIEFAATYFIMLLVLFFIGGGRYASADYWLCKKFCSNST